MAEVEARSTWDAILGGLQLQVTKPIYETWFKPSKGLFLSDNLLTVGVSTPFAVEWLERRMHQVIQTTAQKVSGRHLEVRFQVEGSARNGESDGLFSRNGHQLSGRNLASSAFNLNGKYTFGKFVVGPSNQLPYSAAEAVAEAPGQSYNPLFLYSGVGLGKTHLLHAIAHRCVGHGLNSLYVTSEQFTNEFISSIRNRTGEEFRTKYRGADILLIDDVQFMCGKEQTQEDFFHTINDLHNSNRQVVLTSDRPPGALSLLEDRLKSRFEWGLIADIAPPDLETRMAILRNKAQEKKLDLSDQVVEYIAKKIRKNVRQLESCLNHIAALSNMRNGQVTVDMASEAVATFAADNGAQTADPQRVIDAVTDYFHVDRRSILGAARSRPIVRVRHITMYLLHEELGMKTTEIGRMLGGKDHATVIHAVAKVKSKIGADEALRADIMSVKESLYK